MDNRAEKCEASIKVSSLHFVNENCGSTVLCSQGRNRFIVNKIILWTEEDNKFYRYVIYNVYYEMESEIDLQCTKCDTCEIKKTTDIHIQGMFKK